MANGIYLAGAAMVRQEARQEAMAHNLANTSTPGYKATRVFSSVLDETNITGVDSIRAAEHDQKTYVDMKQGTIRFTGRDLDFGIEGEGFFVVDTPGGEKYTRNGNFSINADGELVNSSGFQVMGDGGPISLNGRGPIEVDESGNITMEGQVKGKILVKNFGNGIGLVSEGQGLYGPRSGVQLQEIGADVRVFQNHLENSNVTGLEEMVNMTAMMKNYEACQKMVQLQNQAVGRLVYDLIR